MSRYSLEKLVRALREPERFGDEWRRLRWEGRRRMLDFNKRYYRWRGRPDDGVLIMDRDWDTMLLLDACRYDMFAEASTLDGDLERTLSLGSQSWEFMEENFVGETFHDTVYVTANPHAYDIPDGTFHAVETLLEDCWDEKSRTVHPETIARETLDALERYPNKRLLVHFMQPHFPFLGPTGDQFEHLGIELHLDDDEKTHAVNPWEGLMFGDELDEETVLRAYRENYDIVLSVVSELVPKLPGKTVLTADHANLIGERTAPIPLSTYGHPPEVYKRELLEVPWLEFSTTGSRRSVTAEQPVQTDDIASETVEQRLEDLGYRG